MVWPSPTVGDTVSRRWGLNRLSALWVCSYLANLTLPGEDFHKLTGTQSAPAPRSLAARKNVFARDALVLSVLDAAAVHGTIERTERGCFFVIHAMIDGLQRFQVGKNSR